MIPLKEAIENELWLKATSEEFIFQIKPLSFRKIDIGKEVDNPMELTQIDINSNIWLLKIEVVNLCRQKYTIDILQRNLILLDIDKFMFPIVTDFHLIFASKFSSSGSDLQKFVTSGFPPKIKKKGSFAFELPEHFDELYIGCKDGNLIAE